jgi:Tfp pilus assembly protein PilF
MSERTDINLITRRRAVALSPQDLSVNSSYALALANSGRPQYAVIAFRRLVQLAGPRPDLLNSLGSSLFASGEKLAAQTQFCLALVLAPGNAKILHNHALTSPASSDNASLRWCERALQVDPGRVDFEYTRGCLLYDRRMLVAARDAYDVVIRAAPEHANAHWNRANIDLVHGRFEDGWRGYEWRWRTKYSGGTTLPNSLGTALQGGLSLDGQTLVLYAEQGLGDTLQFCRYGRLAAEAGARVVLVLPRGLTRLFSAQRWVSQVIEIDEPLPAHELHCPMMSLPLAFGTTLETIPYGKEAYLQALPEDVQRWSHWLDERLGVRDGVTRRLRVGVVWNGGFRADQPELWAVNERRNVPLELFARALDIAGIDFVSLQKGDPAESQLRGREGELWRAGRLVNAAAELNDFADTAGLIMNLDVVISVDTSTAHLAGALGKPTWILNRYDTCWRWLLEREDSPWYGSVKLYRQAADRDWKPVLEKVAGDLRARAAHRAASSIDLA